MVQFHCFKIGLILVASFLSSSFLSSAITTTEVPISRSASTWKFDAADHIRRMDDLLYPPGESLKARTHLVKQHPIYNFIHTYYRYSTQNIKKYSPGLGIMLTDFDQENILDNTYLNEKYIKTTSSGSFYELPKNDAPDSTFGWITLSKTRDILYSTATRQPFFGCFGLHEWAMLYSGRRCVWLNELFTSIFVIHI